jgi:hypothetical protein
LRAKKGRTGNATALLAVAIQYVHEQVPGAHGDPQRAQLMRRLSIDARYREHAAALRERDGAVGILNRLDVDFERVDGPVGAGTALIEPNVRNLAGGGRELDHRCVRVEMRAWRAVADPRSDGTGSAELEGVAELIACPMLVLDAENDEFFRGQPRRVAAALTCPTTLVTLHEADGAGEHCQMGAMATSHQTIFDWLDETLPAQRRRIGFAVSSSFAS